MLTFVGKRVVLFQRALYFMFKTVLIQCCLFHNCSYPLISNKTVLIQLFFLNKNVDGVWIYVSFGKVIT